MDSQRSGRSLRRPVVGASAVVLLIAAIGMLGVRVVHAAAQTLTVNTTGDGPGTCGSAAAGQTCTLRAAIQLANGSSGDTIVVPAGVYDLDAGLGVLDIESAMSVRGAGSATTIVDGGNATRIFSVAAAPVSISGLTVRNGLLEGGTNAGGGIANDGTLSLTDVVVTGNSAFAGGGIASDGPLTLVNVVVSGNRAHEGGGLVLLGNAPTTISASTISDNAAGETSIAFVGGFTVEPGKAGGIWLVAVDGAIPSLTISGSTLSGNSATGLCVPISCSGGPLGGGIANEGGVAHLTNVTIAGNTARARAVATLPATGSGGAIMDTGGLMSISPVSPPRANAPSHGLMARMRAISQAKPSTRLAAESGRSTRLDFVTVAGNNADRVGGIAIFGPIANSIVAGNVGGNCSTGVPSAGFNIETGSDCGFRQTGDQSNVDPKLDSLKLNAPGNTATMALLPGSPAIDAANPQCDQNVDQRGVTRPQGPRCDIGAFEVVEASGPALPAPPVTGVRTVASTPARPAIEGALAILALMAAAGVALALFLLVRTRQREGVGA